jgi:putative membrane protein
MRHVQFSAAVVAISLTVACGGGTPTSPSAMGTISGNAFVETPTLSTSDRDLVNFIAAAYQAQIELGHLAENRGDTDAVKLYARRMKQDSTNALAGLRDFAVGNVPTTITITPTQEAWRVELAGMSGSALDRRYVQIIQVEHQATLTRLSGTAIGNTLLSQHVTDLVTRTTTYLNMARDLDSVVGFAAY